MFLTHTENGWPAINYMTTNLLSDIRRTKFEQRENECHFLTPRRRGGRRLICMSLGTTSTENAQQWTANLLSLADRKVQAGPKQQRAREEIPRPW